MGEKSASGDVSDDTARTPTLSTGPPRAKPNDAGAGRQLAPGLYLVATPIGNLADLTLRARDVLAAADLIACEDTRTTARLLKAHGIDTPTTAYHEHNAPRARPGLLRRLADGGRVALVSDAGTPLISDPGYKLVREAVDAGNAVVPVPGPSAPVAALCASGLPTDRFYFHGFLPAKKQARRHAIEELATLPATLVFFESAKRLAATLNDLADLLGPRDAVIAREVTKLYEEFRRGGLADLAAAFEAEGPPRGEVVLLVGPPNGAVESYSDEEVDGLLRQALAEGGTRDAARLVAEKTGRPRRELYDRAVALKDAGGA